MRRIRAVAIVALMTLAGTVVSLAPAAAQTGYPPGACTPITGAQDAGAFNVGARFILLLSPICLFTPGSSVTVTVNGVNIPGKFAAANGTVRVDITVQSASQLSIDDPVLTPARCGVNTVVGSGPSAVARTNVTQSGTFTVVCPGAATPVQAKGQLSFTGSNTFRILALAGALVAIGLLFVVASRRRRSHAG